jgi:hypothetical protein
MKSTLNLKKTFLISLVVSLSISALIAIFIFLFSDGFGESELKILFTTLVIGLFSLTGLCNSTLYEKGRQSLLTISGMVLSAIGFVLLTGTIWEIIRLSDNRPIFVVIVLVIATAHSSLLLLIQPNNKIVRASLNATLFFIVAVAITLILLVWNEFRDIDVFYYRLLGVFAVLDVLGTIVTPILKKVYSGSQLQ